MFDDQPTGNTPPPGQIPPNLPLGEPEDVFASTDEAPPMTSPQAQSETILPADEATVPTAPSALEAGILKPKTPPAEIPEDISPFPPKEMVSMNSEQLNSPPPTVPHSNIHTMPQDPALQPPQQMYQVKEPTLSRGLMTLIILIVAILVLGGGGWWIYKSFIAGGTNTSPVTTSNDENPQTVDTNTQAREDGGNQNPSSNDSAGSVDDSQILFGQPLDSDGDGLSNDDEASHGTNPENWDTDGDELSDGDEVVIWGTNPTNPDTDGDTYKDGAEIKAGYSPKGPGRMYEPPTTTESITPTSS